MNIFDTTIEIEKNGRLWRLHPLRRYDPLTLAIIATGVGTGLEIAGNIQQGKQEQEIANARAEVDIQNAEAVRAASVEKAKIQGERGRRLIASQKADAAAAGIKINVGSPLVIETETRDSIAKDIGFSLESGRTEADAFRSSAALEIASGKAAKKRSRFAAITAGVKGAGSIAFMGSRLPGKTPKLGPNLPKTGAFPDQAAAMFARF